MPYLLFGLANVAMNGGAAGSSPGLATGWFALAGAGVGCGCGVLWGAQGSVSGYAWVSER